MNLKSHCCNRFIFPELCVSTVQELNWFNLQIHHIVVKLYFGAYSFFTSKQAVAAVVPCASVGEAAN